MGLKEISSRILYYKREDIREAIVASCQDREVGTRFGKTGGFGKRPNILIYPNDVLDMVKKGVSSFHVSEEIWENPMAIGSNLKRNELDELRMGWDLVLDIDCPYWKFSKITTHLFIKALKNHGIKSISCKFSGNKGFHIGVPFSAFPDRVGDKAFKDWFPEGPKRIALYLLNYLAENYITITEESVAFDNDVFTYKEIEKITEKSKAELTVTRCKECKKRLKYIPKGKNEFVCRKCGKNEHSDSKHLICKKCGIIMDCVKKNKSICDCGSEETIKMFDPLSIVEVDTILIASRHLYRAPYSLHEKSGLSSVPIDPDKVLEFDKKMAIPEKVFPEKCPRFLSGMDSESNEGTRLVIQALDFDPQIESDSPVKMQREFLVPEFAIPRELFPPCMIKILEGVEDGKKRSLFILLNFLSSCGWGYDVITELLDEWNKKNPEPLREVLIKGQLRYHKQKKKKVLPPNCRSYYEDFKVCSPDALCKRIKNPVTYAKVKGEKLNASEKKGKKRKERKSPSSGRK